LIAESPRGLCHLSFLSDRSETAATTRLLADWPNAHLQRDDMAATTLGRRVFAKTAFTSPPLPLRVFVTGTDFQVQVWRALLQIPPGQVATYGRLAAVIGHPPATRAVGTAVGRNPLAWLIPCHRVIRQTGALGGYRWGTVRKRAMLAWENCAPEATPVI
jgi:AraC family transcriptional regulator of adaptative response/methylated-DNA-[protein]-cysteine methyltransferase